MAAHSTHTPSPRPALLYPSPQMALPTFLLLAFLLLLLSFAAFLRRRRRPVKDCEPRTPAPVEMEIVAPGESGERGESLNGSEFDTSEECERGEELKAARKKRRKGKKKRRAEGGKGESLAAAKVAEAWLYPFTSSSSAVQRRIKQHYDLLVKSNDDQALTLAQVGQFANILIDVKNDLQNKSEIIQRKFTITKALLLKADRSSFDRLCQQVYRLEAEQKWLEEDTLVYNRLQAQLKLSPAYRKLLEIASKMESQAESCLLEEYTDSEVSDISFEELLAQEKKDSFWQKNGKLVSSSR